MTLTLKIMNVLIIGKLSPVFFNIVEKYKTIKIDIKTTGSKSVLMQLIGSYDAIITRSDTSIDNEILEYAKNLKVILRAGVGIDNIDIDSAAKKGILVINCPFDNIVSTAEHTLALIFAAARNIPHANAALKQGIWQRELFTGIELRGKTLGIIGLGKVGSKLAELVKGIGMSVVAYDPYLLPEKFNKQNVARMDKLDQLLTLADILTIHTPKTNETFNMIDEKELLLTKKGVIIINCARGGIVNENALTKMLDAGHISAAGIDVWENEPAINTALQMHPRVISTPHIGASTREGHARIARTVAEQLIKVFKGEVADFPVNQPVAQKNKMSAVLI